MTQVWMSYMRPGPMTQGPEDTLQMYKIEAMSQTSWMSTYPPQAYSFCCPDFLYPLF